MAQAAAGAVRAEFAVSSRFDSLAGIWSDLRGRVYVVYKAFLESSTDRGPVKSLYWVIEKYGERGDKLDQVTIDDHGEAKVDHPISVGADGRIHYLEVRRDRVYLSEVSMLGD